MLKTKKFVLFLLLGGLFIGCVPNKKIVYLQDGEELKKRNEIVTDSIYRSHKLDITEYRIQPLDNLNIRFETITDPEFDFFSRVNAQGRNNNANNQNSPLNGVLVDTDGMIEYPVIGKVKVAGLTVFEAEDVLQELANKYLKDVVVRIRLQNFRFTILGEVRGGERVVTSNNTRVTLMEAIGMGGGFGELADRSIVKVIRQEEDEAKVYYINLLEEDFIESDKFYVQQNDILIVPPLRQRTFKQYWTSNLGIVVTTVTSVLLLVNLFR